MRLYSPIAARDGVPCDPSRDPRAEAENEQGRRPLREDDVLEEVRGDEVVDSDRRQGAHDREEREHEAREEERRAEEGRVVPSGREDVGDTEPDEDGDLLPGRVPARGGRRLSQQHRFRLTAFGLVPAARE